MSPMRHSNLAPRMQNRRQPVDSDPMTTTAPADPTSTSDTGWTLFTLAQQSFALPVDVVIELLNSRGCSITTLPRMPHWASGIMNHRGRVVPVIDLRTLLGMPSMHDEIQEIVDLLDARETDHIDWLNELKRCVQTGDEFTKATDAHQCAFGVWYDKLTHSESTINEFTGGDIALKSVLESFEAPHKRIHALADKTLAMAKDGHQEEAIALIDHAWNEDLGALQRYFETTKTMIAQLRQPQLIVLEQQARAAILVDTIRSVRTLSPDNIVPSPTGTIQNGLINGIYKDGDQLVSLFDADQFFKNTFKELDSAGVMASQAA